MLQESPCAPPTLPTFTTYKNSNKHCPIGNRLWGIPQLDCSLYLALLCPSPHRLGALSVDGRRLTVRLSVPYLTLSGKRTGVAS